MNWRKGGKNKNRITSCEHSDHDSHSQECCQQPRRLEEIQSQFAADYVIEKGKEQFDEHNRHPRSEMLWIMDSPRNCPINRLRIAPRVFRIPTSWALVAERAVERLMKLIAAMSKTNIAITEKR